MSDNNRPYKKIINSRIEKDLSSNKRKKATNESTSFENLQCSFSDSDLGNLSDTSEPPLNNHVEPLKEEKTQQNFPKVKFCLVYHDKLSVKPSNKILSTFLSKLSGSIYNIKENEWIFENNHYEGLLDELKKNSIEFEKIPQGTLRIARRKIPSMEFSLNSGIFDMLLPFQLEAVNFAINRNGRVLLADEMGLGKTIQALAIAEYYSSEFPLLIVAPASLLNNWVESIKNFLGLESTIIREKCDFGSSISIISYNLVNNCIDVIKNLKYKVIICDECHYLKSMSSKRTQILLPILQNSNRLMMISGTPALSRPLELYPIILSLDKTIFPTFNAYGMRYCNGRMIGVYFDYKGCSNANELSLILEKAFMIRRNKNFVLGNLPKKFRKQVIISSSENYKITEKSFKLDFRKAADNTIISEFVNAVSIKKASVISYLQKLLNLRTKILVFAHHQEMLDSIEEFYKSKNCEYIRIDGSTPSNKRHAMIEKFQNQSNVLVGILSITACSSGLTLTAGKAVVFAELYWNPGTLLQAEDRIHRIGQTDNVEIHYLVCKGTIDEMVWPHILKKLNVLESLGIGKNELKMAEKRGANDKFQMRIEDFRG